MTHDEEQAIDELMRAVGAEIERLDDDLAFQDEKYLSWLARDLRAGQSRREREQDERNATRFAARMQRLILIRRTERALPPRELRYRGAPVVATASKAVALAHAAGCVPLLELSAAAGGGRDLWDEPSETWLDLSPHLPRGPHVAIGVSGDSMVPVLAPDDVILVKLGAAPVVNDLVVARVPDTGFVVKRVAALSLEYIELASFNESYPPIMLQRERSAVVGTVVARFSRGGRGMK